MAGKRGKKDANDAAAICEAASRPHMRFVAVKSAEQQDQLAVPRLREGYKEERTALINRIRGLLTEFGLVFPQTPEALRAVLADVIEDASNELTGDARLALQRAHLHWIDIELQMTWCDERIAEHVRRDARAAQAAQLSCIGSLTALALVASLGRITKRGDDYLRMLLIQGAKSAVFSAHRRGDRISQWLVQLKERVGWQKAVVALANKNARILWAVLTRGTVYDPNNLPEAPAARCPWPQPATP